MSAIGIQGNAAIINEAAMATGATRLVPGIGQLGRDVRGTQELKINRQGNAWKAFTASIRAFGENGPDVVGEYFYIAERHAIANGTLTPTQLASAGLGILSNAPDLYVSRGWTVKGVPVGRILSPFDRMFTHYGNVLRHGIADVEVQLLMAQTGKTAQQLLDDGSVAQIAAFANVFTGVGRRRYGGNAAQFLLFAPRYFHARLKVASDGLMGVLPGANKTLVRRLSAKHMTRYMGYATFLTFSINELTGHETDINPFIRNQATGKWIFNPNFMRIHVADLDISLFGPYDSLLRIVSAVPMAALNAYERGEFSDEILRDLRSVVSAPATSLGLDILAGYNSIGERTRPGDKDLVSSLLSPEMGKNLLEHLIPFSWNDFVFADPGKQSLLGRFSEGVQKVGEGDIGGIGQMVTATGQLGLGVLGVKSSYETVSETMNKAWADLAELGPEDPRIKEAFGVTGKSDARMTQDDLNAIWAGMGEDWWHKAVNTGEGWDISISLRSMFSEKTPTWEQFARDARENISRMTREGRFPEIMEPEEVLALEKRTTERMEQSASEYSQYALKRDARIEEGFNDLLERENEFLGTGGKDLGKFMIDMTKIRKETASDLRNFTGPDGPFEGIGEKLFKFSRETALGNLSTFDKDIFDSAQAWYYTLLYPGEDEKGPDGKLLRGPDNKPITTIVTAGGAVDWDLREERLEMWEDVMKNQFPALSDTKIKSYRRRLEEHQERESPPITGMILDLQDAVAESGYYDVRKKEVAEWLTQYVPSVAKQGMAVYKEWEDASPRIRATMEQQDAWLGSLGQAMGVWKAEFFKKQPHIYPMLVVISRQGSRPKRSGDALTVWNIMERHSNGLKPIKDWVGFLSAVRNIEVDPEAIKRYR